MAVLLAMRDVSKSFFGNRVLSDVDIDLRPDEAHTTRYQLLRGSAAKLA